MNENDHLNKVPKAATGSIQPAADPLAMKCPASTVRLPHARLLDLSKTSDRSGVGRSYIYKQIALNLFPRPIKMGTGRRGAIRFVEAEVEAWIQAKIQSREAK